MALDIMNTAYNKQQIINGQEWHVGGIKRYGTTIVRLKRDDEKARCKRVEYILTEYC